MPTAAMLNMTPKLVSSWVELVDIVDPYHCGGGKAQVFGSEGRLMAQTSAPATTAARSRQCILANSSRLRALARSSKAPWAPASPGSGAQRLSGRETSRGTDVCCAE